MRAAAKVILAAYGTLAVADVVCELVGFEPGARLLPFVLMPLLAGLLWLTSPRNRLVRWVLVGLAFAWLGDCFGFTLLVRIALFLVMQICYCVGFWTYRRDSILGRQQSLLAFGVGVVLIVVGLAREAGRLQVPVAVYGLSLGLMVALAWGIRLPAGFGAVLFFGSDLVLGYQFFIAGHSSELLDGIVMLTYLLGQLLIVLGVRRSASETVDPAPA